MQFKHYSANTVIEEQNRYFLDDVDAGKLLSISSTGFKLPYNCSIQFNNTLRVFSITPETSFTFYYKGEEFTKNSTEQIVLPNQTATYYISYNSNGVLQYSTTFYDLENCVPVSYIYWNSTVQKSIIFADERHTNQMSILTHENLHMTRGCQYAYGLSIGNYTTTGTGSLDSNCQFSVSNGVIYDEDIKIQITNSSTPIANTWQQEISPIANTPIWYMDSSGWNKTNDTKIPVKFGTNTAQYNHYNGTGWGLTDVSDTFYFSMYIVASNGLNTPIFVIMGQQTNNKLSNLQISDTYDSLNLSQFPVAEFRPLYRLIFQTSSSYTNSVKSRLVDVLDIRMVSSSISGITASDHGLLSGLGDDDHPQYIHIDNPRVITAKHTLAPTMVQAPFVLGSNAQGVLVNGFNADMVDGYNSTAFEFISNKGIANGYPSLGSDGKVPSTQLPSYVDDVIEYSTNTLFPTTGETGKIYIAIDTNKCYRWSGSQYIYITSGAVDSVNGYTGVVALTKNDIGLSNLDNLKQLPYTQTLSITGDIIVNTTNINTGTLSSTLSNSGVTAGSYTKITVDSKGRATSGSNPTTLSGYGITDGAPLASPALTGTPTTPTPTTGSNTTQIANTAFVQTSCQMLGDVSMKMFSYNSNVLGVNVTIPSGANASAVGPISVAEGIVVSVSDGSRLVIL